MRDDAFGAEAVELIGVGVVILEFGAVCSVGPGAARVSMLVVRSLVLPPLVLLATAADGFAALRANPPIFAKKECVKLRSTPSFFVHPPCSAQAPPQRGIRCMQRARIAL